MTFQSVDRLVGGLATRSGDPTGKRRLCGHIDKDLAAGESVPLSSHLLALQTGRSGAAMAHVTVGMTGSDSAHLRSVCALHPASRVIAKGPSVAVSTRSAGVTLDFARALGPSSPGLRLMEHRRHPRSALSVPVMLTGNTGAQSPIAAKMINLSAGGMYFRGPALGDFSRATISR